MTMNHEVLSRYSLKFSVEILDGRRMGIVRTTAPENMLSGSLEDLFVRGYPDGFIRRILKNIERALHNVDFDPTDDGGPEFVSVRVGKEICVIKSIREKAPVKIPTEDLKQILIAWTDYFEKNDIDVI